MKITVGQLRRLIESEVNTGAFAVGDQVKMGKYKNKKGTIKRAFLDDKDHVSIEVKPDKKGARKNIEMSLYKVWPDETDD